MANSETRHELATPAVPGAVQIRAATPSDASAVWSILEPAFRGGETYAIEPDIGRDEALSYWFAPAHRTFVAVAAGEVLGTYYLRRNHGGGGAHVCNCGFVTSERAQGRGAARAMLAHSLDEARSQGFLAMQFNFVVSTNTRAIALWESAGFRIVGRLPKAFRTPAGEFVDSFVMYRSLDQ